MTLDALLLDPFRDPRNVWIVAGRAGNVMGSGTIADPYNGGSAERFDTIMNSMLPPNCSIELGPGVFETKGHLSGTLSAWIPKSGWRIRGAGIGLTTIKLVGADFEQGSYQAIGNEGYLTGGARLDGFSVENLTIDCNVDFQLVQHVDCSAIRLTGPNHNVLIKRVRVIHFGTKTIGYRENFPIAIGAGHPQYTPDEEQSRNCVIEECIAEFPGENNNNNSSVFIIGGGEDVDSAIPRLVLTRGCAIRNCYINCAYPDGVETLPVPVESIAHLDGRRFRVTTRRPHRRQPCNYISLHNVFLNNTIENVFNGRYSSVYLIESVEPERTEFAGRQFVFTLPPLTREAATEGAIDWALGGVVDAANAFAGARYVGLTGEPGLGAVVEGNRVFNCAIGGPYHDFHPSRDLVTRENYYGNCWAGPVETLGAGFVFLPLSDLRYKVVDGKFKAVAKAAIDMHNIDGLHYLESGYVVDIQSDIPDDDDPIYNGRFPIRVISPSEFEYDLPGKPGHPPEDSASQPRRYARGRQVRRLATEDNVMELRMNPFMFGQGSLPRGIVMETTSPLTYHEFVLRGNIVRISPDDRYADQHPLGVYLESCENGLVENNLLGTGREDALFYTNTLNPNVRFFHNRRPSGEALRSWNAIGGILVGRGREIADDIDDAMTLALLKRRS